MCITIEGTPPSVNHYKKPVMKFYGRERRKSFELTPEAILWRDLVWIAAAGRTIAPLTKRECDRVRYQLTARIYLGPGERGDGDNFWKCIADSLQHAGVIHSDARVRKWLLEVIDEDRANPRTEIVAEVLST